MTPPERGEGLELDPDIIGDPVFWNGASRCTDKFLARMAKAPTTFAAWAIRDALEELQERRALTAAPQSSEGRKDRTMTNTMSSEHPHDEAPVLDAEGRCLVCSRYVLDDDRRRIIALCESAGIGAEPDSLPSQWGHDTVRRVSVLAASVATLEAALKASRERERSMYAWAKAARRKDSGLPPSRALRWIDEMGNRLVAASALGGQPDE